MRISIDTIDLTERVYRILSDYQQGKFKDVDSCVRRGILDRELTLALESFENKLQKDLENQ